MIPLTFPYKYGQFGPGGGSVPGWVMRAGQVAPFNPLDARHDIVEENVERAVRVPVAYPPGVAEYGPPPLRGTLVGHDAFGRPVAEFQLPGAPSPDRAMQMATTLRRAAAHIQRYGLAEFAVPSLVGAPLAALAAGGTVVLRWANGVKVSVAPGVQAV
jgi:hypothetical protein